MSSRRRLDLSSRLPSYRVRAVHLTAVWAYGVSQPIFSLVDGNKELLVAHNATRLDALVVVTLLALLPPLAATGYAWVAGRASQWVGDVLYLAILGAFLAPLAVRVLKSFDPSIAVTLIVITLMCASAVVLYARFRAVRMFLGFSIVLPIVGLLLFARGLPPLSGEAHAATTTTIQSPHPVVMLVLDEFSVSSLMTQRGEIDAVRYPNFARLAREGTWYPNATAVHDATQAALPAILTGRIERVRELPIAYNYPDNLFTLLGEEYALFVREGATRLCPQAYCPQYETSFLERLKDLSLSFRSPYLARTMPDSFAETFRDVDFERVQGGKMEATLEGFDEFLGEITPGEPEQRLHFAHVLLPHSPWRFLPSGAEYEFQGRDGLLDRDHWSTDQWLVRQAHQRHLLQVGFTDLVLGRLLARLEESGLYDRALIIVLADHGISFQPGVSHRWVSEDNILDIANVPLFVRYPGQREGRSDPRLARIVDIVPTIADVLGFRLPWSVDGESLLGTPAQRDTLQVTNREGRTVSATLAEMVARRGAVLRFKAAHFGEGDDSLFGIGVNRDLLGSAVPASPATSTTVRVRIENGDDLADVDTGSGFVPARISGVIIGERIESRMELAVAVNGRIQALTRASDWDGAHVLRAFVSETSFVDGFNRIDVFAIERDGKTRSLVWLGSNASSPPA